MSVSPIAYANSLRIGTVDFVSPDEIKVLLEIEAPDSIALNSGVPQTFPRINGYVLIPSDDGHLVGQIEWITIERSQYPKRKGMQDFGLIDLPFPLRKMSLNPLGTLSTRNSNQSVDNKFLFKRGVNSFPSVGDSVLLPTQKQLHAIVESGENRRIKIGTSPLAGNAEVRIDPDRLFGRHLAILGNTGSGKSCSVAGLVRWSLEEAKKSCAEENPNARFIILDPNGEYGRAFQDFSNARFFAVEPNDQVKQLQVPLWFWNSAEWNAFTKASAGAQKPAIQQALRQRRNSRPTGEVQPEDYNVINYLQGAFSTVHQSITNNVPFSTTNYAKYMGFLENLRAINSSLTTLKDQTSIDLDPLCDYIDDLLNNRCKTDQGYTKPFEYDDIDQLAKQIELILIELGAISGSSAEINEDVPIPFSSEDLITDLNFIATNSGNRQWFDSLLARIKTMLADTRMKTIMEKESDIGLENWLKEYIGDNNASNGTVTVIDLSLVPSDIIHIVTSVIARMTFEALQRYKKQSAANKTLPTVIVMEEAHIFIKRYNDDAENQNAAAICCQVFERIAREGRKFGLGLVLSSQRPSELSPTVLSQCNSFLLHRLSNDRDQEIVKKLVPDNLKGLLRDLPSLPSQNAILLGWASELPLLLKMDYLPKEHQPLSDDPDFWNVWTGKGKDQDGEDIKIDRPVNWEEIAKEWQHSNVSTSDDSEEKDEEVDENIPF